MFAAEFVIGIGLLQRLSSYHRLCRRSVALASATDGPLDAAVLRGLPRAWFPRAGPPPGIQSEARAAPSGWLCDPETLSEDDSHQPIRLTSHGQHGSAKAVITLGVRARSEAWLRHGRLCGWWRVVNARDTQNLRGRKSDVQESQWLIKLHTYGSLRNSFRPTQEIRRMRTYWRQRNDLVQSAALHAAKL